MRLTKSDKEAFVRAVMDDVPEVDYQEQVRSKIMAWALSIMPDKVRAVYNEYPQYFETNLVNTPRGCWGVNVPIAEYVGDLGKRAPELWAELVDLGTLCTEQCQARRTLESKVRGLIETCSTLKKAHELLPEFTKYLPADRDQKVVANLPVANTVTELMLAGWPKNQERKAA